MSIKKQYLKSKPLCKVTFRVPKEEATGAKTVRLIGDFNNWNTLATPMVSHKNGAFTKTIDLDLNKEYQFRYLKDDLIWENDPEADKYLYCSYGACENSVIVV